MTDHGPLTNHSAPPPPAYPHSLSEEELSAIYRAKLMFRVLVVVGIVFMVAVSAIVVGGVWLIRSTQVHTASLAEETHKSTALIESCVNPGGKCYQRAKQRTGDAVGQLNRYVVLSASCTAHIATATHGLAGISQTDLTKLITACVRSQLAIQAQRER